MHVFLFVCSLFIFCRLFVSLESVASLGISLCSYEYSCVVYFTNILSIFLDSDFVKLTAMWLENIGGVVVVLVLSKLPFDDNNVKLTTMWSTIWELLSSSGSLSMIEVVI